MRPRQLSPILLIPPPLWRIGRDVLLLAWFASGSIAQNASSLTLTIDCAFCGKGVPFPHDCPRVNSAEAALATAEAFSSLVETARTETRRLRAVSGINLPELGDVGTIVQLNSALTNLIAATEEEIARCERERADYLRKSESVDAENARLAQLASQISDEIAQARATVVETEAETTAEIRAASAARDEIIALQKSLNEIREEIRQVRNRLFPQLHQAAHRGWIHPPSTYRPMPAPLPPKNQVDGYNARDVRPAHSPVSTLDGPGQMSALTLSTAAAPKFARVERSDVQAKLDQLPGLWERARAAVARRDDAIRSLEHQRSTTDAQSSRLATLQPQRTAAASQLAAVKRNLTIARQANADYTARLSTARAGAVHAWIEWGIFHLMEKKAAALLPGGEGRSLEAKFLDAWRNVAATAVQLGSDPLGVIAQFPTATAARGENLDDLKEDLARVRDKFGVGFAASSTGLPPTALPYLTREVR